jgi:hypothetical protein
LFLDQLFLYLRWNDIHLYANFVLACVLCILALQDHVMIYFLCAHLRLLNHVIQHAALHTLSFERQVRVGMCGWD